MHKVHFGQVQALADTRDVQKLAGIAALNLTYCYVHYRLRIQMVAATHALNLSAGVSKSAFGIIQPLRATALNSAQQEPQLIGEAFWQPITAIQLFATVSDSRPHCRFSTVGA